MGFSPGSLSSGVTAEGFFIGHGSDPQLARAPLLEVGISQRDQNSGYMLFNRSQLVGARLNELRQREAKHLAGLKI